MKFISIYITQWKTVWHSLTCLDGFWPLPCATGADGPGVVWAGLAPQGRLPQTQPEYLNGTRKEIAGSCWACLKDGKWQMKEQNDREKGKEGIKFFPTLWSHGATVNKGLMRREGEFCWILKVILIFYVVSSAIFAHFPSIFNGTFCFDL